MSLARNQATAGLIAERDVVSQRVISYQVLVIK